MIILKIHQNIAPKITDVPNVSDDPTTYFKEYIMNAPFLDERPQEMANSLIR